MTYIQNIINTGINQHLNNLGIYLVYYYIIINIYGFIITGVDKRKARRRQFRTKELSFFVSSLLGGALGVVMGMTVFRHKTQKREFYIGIPSIFLLNLVVLFLIYRYLI
ncbi:DUF1294 domain-containing protein [Tepidibacter mesophilus]|uniref:DUF1294 domain-containing protein n=1 Tax=Tepidibacter mesophilus TaxID=655607 RepID=UPI000C08C879|nr:DUF1294 domain-containing protein [Tepidibacter mesophilus]